MKSKKRTPISVFGQQDFVFLDVWGDPYFVRHEPRVWLHYWHEGTSGWVTKRLITDESELFAMRALALPRDEAGAYFATD